MMAPMVTMPVPPTPAAYCLLEGWSEPAVHAETSIIATVMRLTEIMELANRLAGCDATPADSQVYVDGQVRRVLFGIDVDLGEILLARALGVDGVIAHHPVGNRARLGIPTIIRRHRDQMEAEGIPSAVAEPLALARARPVARALHSANYDRIVEAARQLQMPLMNIHLAADILARRFFEDFVRTASQNQSLTVAELVASLALVPEMARALVKPELWLGDERNPVGRWMVQMAAGTNGGAAIYRTYYEHGIDTILAMHLDDRDLRELEQLPRPGANLIITGHMPSDSIGVNRVITAIEDQGVEVIAGAGVIRA
jgi:putative NIF3 family GTP cyclohydrolase 1 type 2